LSSPTLNPLHSQTTRAHNTALTNALGDNWDRAYEICKTLMVTLEKHQCSQLLILNVQSPNKLVSTETALLHMLCADHFNDTVVQAEIIRNASTVDTEENNNNLMLDDSDFVMEP
jgi:hypothetical protein